MKKALYILTAVLLIGVVLTGCGKKENPFEPTTDSFNATGAMESQGPTAINGGTIDGDEFLFLNPTYDEIYILFDADINPSTVNNSTIILVDAEYLSTPLTAYTVTYDQATKKATIKTTTQWDDDKSYLVKVTPGVKDIHGHALDGNSNGWVDPQDTLKGQIWGANSTVGTVDLIPPKVTMLDPVNDGIYFSISDSIEISITDNDSVDLTTVTGDKFELTTASGQVVALPAIYVYEFIPATSYTVRFRPLTNLQDSTDYFLTVKTGIKDKKGNTLSGNGNNISEAEVIDRKRIKFRTYDPRNGGIPAQNTNLRVVSATFVDANRALEIRFSRKMNATTLTSANIKLYDNNDCTGYITGAIHILPDTMGVRYDLNNASANTNYLWVSRTVKDALGFFLDENDNGIGGEAAYTDAVGSFITSDDLKAVTVNYTAGYTLAGFHTVLFNDMVELGNQGWSIKKTTLAAHALWHIAQKTPAGTPFNDYGKYTWHCANVDSADTMYSIGSPIVAVDDSLISPVFDLTTYGNAQVVFDLWTETDDANDRLRVYYSYLQTDGSWTAWFYTGYNYSGTSAWGERTIGIPDGYQVKLLFRFNTNAIGNTTEGIYMDNIRVEVW